MNIESKATDRQIVIELGERIARHRLSQNVSQDQLAREAGVSKRTVVRLENGESSQLTNLIRILRALNLLDNLDALIPNPQISPIAALQAQARERRRASPSNKKPRSQSQWTWGDDKSAQENKA